MQNNNEKLNQKGKIKIHTNIVLNVYFNVVHPKYIVSFYVVTLISGTTLVKFSFRINVLEFRRGKYCNCHSVCWLLWATSTCMRTCLPHCWEISGTTVGVLTQSQFDIFQTLRWAVCHDLYHFLLSDVSGRTPLLNETWLENVTWPSIGI